MSKYQGWKREPISKHIESYQSGIASGEKSRDTGFAHLRMNNISTRFTLNRDEMWYIPASDEEKKKYSVKKGDLLFNNTNSDDLVGKSCVFELETDDVFLFSNHITRIRTKESLDPLYLLYWVKSLWDKQFFKDNCTKWVNQAAVRPEDLLLPKEIFLPPTVEDQIAIARDLQSQLAHVETMRQAALKQKEAAKALQSAILREVFPWQAGESLPNGWRWEKLGNLVKMANGVNSDQTKDSSLCPISRIETISFGNIDFSRVKYSNLTESQKEKYEIREGEILFSHINSKERVGNLAIAEKLPKPIYHGINLLKFTVNDITAIAPKYLYFVLQSKQAKDYFFDNSQDAINQSSINQSTLSRLEVPLPATRQQQEKVISTLENMVNRHVSLNEKIEECLESIEALSAAILREAFNFQNVEN